MKVLGYDKADGLTDLKAYGLLEDYRNSISEGNSPVKASKVITKQQSKAKPVKKEALNTIKQSDPKTAERIKKIERD